MRPCRRSWFGAIAAAVTALLGFPRTSKGAMYHPGHNCPRCGRVVMVVYCQGPYPGTHTHRHGQTLWYHRTNH